MAPTETPIYATPLGDALLARGAPEAILPPLIIGTAVVFGAGFAHIAIGQVMSPRGADLLLYLLAAPGTALLLVAIFLLWFYRDPARRAQGPIVSAADGKVVLVEPIRDDPHVGNGHRVAVFMSPLDVHVNRLPASAVLLSTHHHPGGYMPAFKKESERNERLESLWRATGDADGMAAGTPIKIVQIAGAMAKRIVPWVEDGAELRKAERFGMIKLGSRVDVYLPEGYRPTVAVGDRVRAGETPLAVPVS